MDGLDCILKTDASLAELIEECGGLTSLDDLQQHENDTVFERVSKFMKKYFITEDEEPAEDASSSMQVCTNRNQYKKHSTSFKNLLI